MLSDEAGKPIPAWERRRLTGVGEHAAVVTDGINAIELAIRE